jgi:hypothetical protein
MTRWFSVQSFVFADVFTFRALMCEGVSRVSCELGDGDVDVDVDEDEEKEEEEEEEKEEEQQQQQEQEAGGS